MLPAQNRQSVMVAVCITAAALLLNATHNQRHPDGTHRMKSVAWTPANAAFTTTTNKSGEVNRPSETQTAAKKLPTAFAPSLRGTQRDGSLRTDENGNLIIERGIRDLFDYHLTTLGEHDLQAIRQQLRSIFVRELPAQAAHQATLLLDAYLLYRDQSGALQDGYPALNEHNAAAVITDYFSQRSALRQRLFTADAADAFFSADTGNEQTALQTLQRLSDPKTDMPGDEPEKSAENPYTHSYTKYREAVRSAPKETLAQDTLRNELFGREAADRLASLDQQRNDWNTRLANYRQQKQQLQTAATHAGIDSSAQLQQLQQSHFNEREILRVRALDRLQQHVSPSP